MKKCPVAELVVNPPQVISASQIAEAFKEQATGDVLIDDAAKTVREAICPTCGRKTKTAMSNAERQRQYRERKRAK